MMRPAVMVPQFCGEIHSSLAKIRYVMNAARKFEKGWAGEPRLVAVSKKHSVEAVSQAYHCGVRHFGENYVKDLHQKSSLLSSPEFAGVKWHLLGPLQCNKAKLLTNISNLWMVESVERVKVANMLDRLWSLNDRATSPLRVLVQVNTSGEEHKAGCSMDAYLDVAAHVHLNCPHLQFCGLMTVGREGTEHQPNPDFVSLLRCSNRVKDALQIQNIELSMGMSNNYRHAIELGSTNVRIGTALFGGRPAVEEEEEESMSYCR